MTLCVEDIAILGNQNCLKIAEKIHNSYDLKFRTLKG